jgi:hypothetical protein
LDNAVEFFLDTKENKLILDDVSNAKDYSNSVEVPRVVYYDLVMRRVEPPKEEIKKKPKSPPVPKKRIKLRPKELKVKIIQGFWNFRKC